MRAGFVAIVGLPNVGKSTLLNQILGQKIAIASPRPQTTRNRILGVKNRDDAQLVLLDTPGFHRPSGRGRNPLNHFMVNEALAAMNDVDALLLLVEAPSGVDAQRVKREGYRVGKDVQPLLAAVRESGKPVVLGINKVDRFHDKSALLPMLETWGRAHGFRAMVPISAATGAGVEQLQDELCALLPEGERLFPEDVLTDRAERWLAAELVREQAFLLTRQEIPYAVAVTVDEFLERPARPGSEGERPADVMLQCTLHVEKEAQKRIVVGEGGRMVREIGTRARLEIERLLDCPVHLKLFVRVDPDWSEHASGLRKMGYSKDGN